MIEKIANKNLTLLYVEDCSDSRKRTGSIFQTMFEKVIFASNGEDGFDKFKKNKIDIIFTDIVMPKLNGMEMIKKIREIDRDIYIVALSAHNNIKYLTQSIKYQIQGYLFKPLDRKQFRESLDTFHQQLTEKKNEQSKISLLQNYKTVVDDNTIISKTDINGTITYVNDEFCKVSGYSRMELIGKNHNIIRSPYESKELFKDLWKSIKKNKASWHGVIQNQTKNSELFYVQSTIRPIVNANGKIDEFIASRTVITDIIHPHKQLRDFVSTLDESIVVLIKIEDFKYIDGVSSKKLSEKLQRDFAIKVFDLLAKECNFSKIYLLDDGEFAVAQAQYFFRDENDLVDKIKAFKNHVNQEKINFKYIDYDLSIMVSLAYGQNALEDALFGLKKLLKTKQSFLLANGLAKKNKDKAIAKIATFKMIKKAIDSYNIVSYFQPIVNNKSNKIEKYESLVRLIDDEGTVLTPQYFLDVAKKGKYYREISFIVLENSFKVLKEKNIAISINFSVIDIENKENTEKLFDLLEKYKKEAYRLTLELLEDEKIKDMEFIKSFITQVKSYGVKIAIDDFGVGQSNFQRVLEFQPDILKIDGSLIRNIEEDSSSFHMVETIVDFAQKQKLQTIAEYVENENIYNILCRMGVNYSQGYYFGKAKKLE